MSKASGFQEVLLVRPAWLTPGDSSGLALGMTGRKSQAGFSLLELLLVVAVGAVLILAGLGAYRLVSENNNTNQSLRQLATLKQQVQQTFQGQPSYGSTGTLLTTMQSMRAVPPEMAVTNVANGAMRGALGPVTVTTAGANSTTFIVTMTQVPRSACVKLAQSYTVETSSDLQSVTINGAAIAAGGFTQAALVASCANASNNTLVWTFL